MENPNDSTESTPDTSPEPSISTNPTVKKSSLKLFIGLFAVVILLGIGFNMTGNVTNEGTGTKVLLKTNHGDITIDLYEDMPITTGNFIDLAQKGTYNGVIFHRIIDGFMIQGGDPTGTGMGDPKIPNIQDEFTHAGGNRNKRGTISMANAGPNTGSSQFFINLVDNSFLDTKHPAFGEVIEGMDVVDKIAKVQKDGRDKPLEDVTILEAKVL